MKRAAVYLIILLISPYFGAGLRFAYPENAAQPGGERQKAGEESYREFEASRKILLEKMAKRTKEYRDLLDGFFFTVNSHARKAIKDKDFKSEKEFISVLSDYNSVLGDLGLMQVILDMNKFVDDKEFIDYYMLMESAFERLKDNFSLKNELFLDRISKFRNQDALRYEKKLLKYYKDYFEYDLRLDKVDVKKDALGAKNDLSVESRK